MKPPKKLYQTLEDRDNPDYVENHGPFPCRWDNTWLGTGYYYWDHFFDIAKWWGSHRYKGNCIICEAFCDFHEYKVLDLVGEPQDIEDFKVVVNRMKEEKLFTNKTTVARVISYMKDTLKIFDYEAIRVHGINSINAEKITNKDLIYRLLFEVKDAFHAPYLDLNPPIQICIYKKNGLGIRNYKIVYPDHYREEAFF